MTVKSNANAIIIMVDQMKATASHLYGEHGIDTPGLARLARLGVRYEHATTPHPLCVPARVALWTGLDPHRTGCTLNKTPMPEGMPHAAKWWKAAGYELAMLGKNHCFGLQSDRDLFDVWCEIEHYGFKDRMSDPGSPRGMAWVESPQAVTAAHAVRNSMPTPEGGASSFAVTDFEERHYSTGLLCNQADAFVRAPHEKPYALWLSIPDPHVPYETPRSFFERARARDKQLPPAGPMPGEDLPMRNRTLSAMMRWPDDRMENLKDIVTAYHANVLHIDKLIGTLLDTLEETGQLNDTIIVFCSDHGDFAGEHGMAAKGGVLYDCLVRIPLIVAAPGRFPQNAVEPAPVSLTDVIPTVFLLQDLPVPEALDGVPLPPCPEVARRAFSFALYGAGGPAFTLADLKAMDPSYGHQALFKTVKIREREGQRSMVRNAQWKLVHDPMGDLDELYHLSTDPYEHDNLAAAPAHAGVKKSLMDELYRWRGWS